MLILIPYDVSSFCKHLVVSILLTLLAAVSYAECRDFDAMAAADKKAKSFYKNGKVFHPAAIQKIHHPSRKKEVASYIKTGEKHYSIFTLVDHDCKVEFRKRTRQND